MYMPLNFIYHPKTNPRSNLHVYVNKAIVKVLVTVESGMSSFRIQYITFRKYRYISQLQT